MFLFSLHLLTIFTKVVIFSLQTPPTNPNRAHIVEYEVIWNTAGNPKGDNITNTCKPALILNNTGEHTVVLRARNRQRSSTASVITVPTTRPGRRTSLSKLLIACSFTHLLTSHVHIYLLKVQCLISGLIMILI